MRRFATTILALGAGLSLSACHTVGRLSEANTITGKPVQTEMIVANHTGKAITVTFDRSPDTTGALGHDIDLDVPPSGDVRFTGKQGDALIIHAADEPPLRLIFARRSQVVKVSEDAGEVRYDIRRGYTNPSYPSHYR